MNMPIHSGNDRWKWIQTLLIAGLAPFFLFPSQGRIWIFLCVPVFLVAKGLVRKKIFERTALDWPIAVLAVQVVVSSIRFPDWEAGLPKAAGIAFGLLVFYVVADSLNTRTRVGRGTAGFVTGGVLLAAVGLLGMNVQERFYFRSQFDVLYFIHQKIPKIRFNLPGAEEGFNPNAVGGALALIFPVVFAFAVSGLKKKKTDGNHALRAGLIMGAVFLAAVLVLTASRAAWAGTAVACAVAVWILFPVPKRKVLSLVVLLGAAGLVFVAGYALLVKPGSMESAMEDVSRKYQGRMQAWGVGVESIRQAPLTGIGLNRIRLDPRIGYERAHVHNHMLHSAAELGIPALAAYLAIMMGAGWMCRDVFRKSRDDFERTAAVGLGTGQLAHFLFGLGDSVPLGAKAGIFFWVSLGLIAALYNRTTRPGFPAGIHAGVPKIRSGTSLSPVSRAAISISVVLPALFLYTPAMAKEESRDHGPRRVLSVARKAAVVYEPPSRSDKMRADGLVSGRRVRAWRSRRGDSPPFVFVFALALDSRINGLRFSNSRNEEKLKGIGAKEVEVEFSLEGPDSGWRSAGVFLLEPGPAPQEFAIPPSRARWVRLTVRSNHGHRRYTELAKFEAWGNYIFDVPFLLSHALWILGAALILAVFSFCGHQGHRDGLRLRQALGRPSFRQAVAAGTALVAAGLAAAAVLSAGGGLAAPAAGTAAGGAVFYFAVRKKRSDKASPNE